MAVRFLQRRRTFFGYNAIRRDVIRLAHAVDGDISRDDQGLIVKGSHQSLPVVVRFYLSGSSRVGIRMETAANFHMSICGRSISGIEGRTRISTQDSQFDSKFLTTSNNSTEARLFVRVRQVMPIIKGLCVSPSSSLQINAGSLEVQEALEDERVFDFVMKHCGAMATLAGILREMPGARAAKIIPYRRKKNLLPRLAVAASLTLALFAAIRLPGIPAQAGTPSDIALPQGIAPGDAAQLASLSGWRLMRESDFDSDGAAWLQSEGLTPAGRIAGNFSGGSEGNDVAYILVNHESVAQVALFSSGARVYDQRYQHVAVATRIPHSSLSNIAWRDRVAGDFDGDGVLIVARAEDRTSGVVLALRDGKVTVNFPTDYRKLSLF